MRKCLGFHPGHRIRQYHTIQIITVIKCCIINSGHTFRERHTFCRASGKSKASDLRGSFWYTHCFDRLVTIIFPLRNRTVFCLRSDILRFSSGLLSCYRFRIALLHSFFLRQHHNHRMISYDKGTADHISGHRCRCRGRRFSGGRLCCCL